MVVGGQGGVSSGGDGGGGNGLFDGKEGEEEDGGGDVVVVVVVGMEEEMGEKEVVVLVDENGGKMVENWPAKASPWLPSSWPASLLEMEKERNVKEEEKSVKRGCIYNGGKYYNNVANPII